MQTNIHLSDGGSAEASDLQPGTFTLDLMEADARPLTDKVVVFVDREAARKVAIAALTALYVLGDQEGASYVNARDGVLHDASHAAAALLIKEAATR